MGLITEPKDLQLPSNRSSALQFLPVHKGHSCCQCRFLTIILSQRRCLHSLCLLRLQGPGESNNLEPDLKHNQAVCSSQEKLPEEVRVEKVRNEVILLAYHL